MPLKVSSVGWVKVAPPPRTRKRQVHPEEQKESLCSSLRYFACQGLDPSRERLRMLGGRAGFSSSQVDLQRPHSRLERSSTLDEWRHDVYPSRSSSRQSSHPVEIPDPHRSPKETNHNPGNGSRRSPYKTQAACAPRIISASPSPSIYDEEQEEAGVEAYPDHASVAHSETPSERHCRHNHRHHRPQKVPSAIPEEDESEVTKTSTSRLWYGEEEKDVSHSIPAPPPSPAPFNSEQFHDSDIEVAQLSSSESPKASDPVVVLNPTVVPTSTVTLEPIQEQVPLRIEKPVVPPIETPIPLAIPAPDSETAEAVKSRRSRRADRSDRSDALSVSSRSSRASKSSRSSRSSSSYTSSHADTESDTASSYTASVRSASPVRDQKGGHERSRYEKLYKSSRDDGYYEDKAYGPSHRDRYTDRNFAPQHYDDNDHSLYHHSPPVSPTPMSHRKSSSYYDEPDTGRRSYERPLSTRTPRDRNVTAPPVSAPSKHSSTAYSTSSWSSSRSSDSRSSRSGTSTAPSIDGYQFQAAIFQPKGHYQGYRAPSLSKGNRWETATSALSFD